MSQTEKTDVAKGHKATGVIASISSILLPLVLLYLGHVYKETEQKDGIHEKYVEMAIKILENPPEKEDRALREWAVKILHEYSEIPIHSEAQDHILNRGLNSSDTASGIPPGN